MSIWIIVPIAGCIAILLTLWVACHRAPLGEEIEGVGFIQYTKSGTTNGSYGISRYRDNHTSDRELDLDNNKGEAKGEVGEIGEIS